MTDKRLVRVTSLTPNALDFACHSKACAPPPVGKGGSNEGGASGGSVHPDAEGIFRAVKGMSPGVGKTFPSAKDAQDMRNMQSAMYAAAGYDGKARVVGAAQFDELVGRGKEFEEAWRGVAAFDQNKTTEQVGRGLIDDARHYPGNGIYGNGTYFAHNSASPSLGQAIAKDYGPMMTRGGIPKSMRETKYADIEEASAAARLITSGPDVIGKSPTPMEASARVVVEAGRKAGLSDTEINGVVRDAGRMAILMGVSGYTAPQKNGIDYVVVLNRGALVLDRTVHDETSRGGYIPQEGYTRQGLKRGGEDLSAEDLEDLACHSRACAPPPIGAGGSNPGGSGGRVEIGPGMVPKNAGKVIAAGASREDEQEMQSAMYEAAGYHGSARVVSRGEFNDLVDEGMPEGWRGVIGSGSQAEGTLRERGIARSLIDDDYHFPGRGIYGNGTYVAYQEDSTFSARNSASAYGTNLLRIGLTKQITETDFADVRAVEEAVADYVYGDGPYMGKRPQDDSAGPADPKAVVAYDTAKKLVDMARAEGVEDFDTVAALGDTGRVAIALGLDGYTVKKAKGEPGAEYSIVLNRSAITLDRTVYDDSGILSKHLADGHDNLGEKT